MFDVTHGLAPDCAAAWYAGRAGADARAAGKVARAAMVRGSVRLAAAPNHERTTRPADVLTLERMGLPKAAADYLASLPEADRAKVVPTELEAEIAARDGPPGGAPSLG